MKETLTLPADRKPRTDNDLWRQYEKRKAEFLRENKMLTAEEYDRAIRQIANDLGI